MDTCEVCKSAEARYRCPRCSRRTCSVGCVRTHKGEDDCSGFRDRTKFVGRSEYDETHLMSDYSLLGEMDQSLDAGSRTVRDLTTNGMSRKTRNMRNKLRRQAYQNGVRMFQMPTSFSRTKRNTSTLRDNGVIFWRVEVSDGNWVKNSLNDAETKHVALERVSEKTTIQDIVRKAMDEAAKRKLSFGSVANLDSSEFAVFLVADKEEAGTFWQAEPSSSLQAVLNCRCIIEFPRLIVTDEQDRSSFPPPSRKNSDPRKRKRPDDEEKDEQGGENHDDAAGSSNASSDASEPAHQPQSEGLGTV